MADALDLETKLTEADVVASAAARYDATNAYAGAIQKEYDRYMGYYDPAEGDQWPYDADERPDMIHATINMVKNAVDIESRLQGILPRISLMPSNPHDQNERDLAEVVEKMHLNWLEDSGWDVWLTDFCRIRAIAGKGVLQPYWDDDLNQPSVYVIEHPASLRVGYGDRRNFRKKDWAIYEYTLSPLEAQANWPDIRIDYDRRKKSFTVWRGTDHTDPLDTIPNYGMVGSRGGRAGSTLHEWEDEATEVRVWDYWYKKLDENRKSIVCNATIVEGQLVDGPNEHPEFIDIPFIVVENDHRPGSPEGISSVKYMIDIQDEYNRAVSHWLQNIADYTDPAYQVTGENSNQIPAGRIPKGGEMIPTGTNNEIKPINRPQNIFPMQMAIAELKDAYHKTTGLSEIVFGALPGSQSSGRALATQIEAVANRISPRRDRLYTSGIKEVFRFWRFMAEKKDAEIPFTDEEGAEQTLRLKPLFDRVGKWKITAPEITPRDAIEFATLIQNRINGKTLDLESGIDKLGEDNPGDIVRRIMAERNNIDLFPGDVQMKLAGVRLLMEMGQLQEAQRVQSEVARANEAQGDQQAQAQPALDQVAGGEGFPMPASQPGTGPVIDQQQTLIRSDLETGQAQPLNQVAIR